MLEIEDLTIKDEDVEGLVLLIQTILTRSPRNDIRIRPHLMRPAIEIKLVEPRAILAYNTLFIFIILLIHGSALLRPLVYLDRQYNQLRGVDTSSIWPSDLHPAS